MPHICLMDPALHLTRLSELGNRVTPYGLQDPGFHGCVSWSYLRIGHGVVVATQPEHGDCGTSITNIWDEYFFRSLQSLPQVTQAGPTVRCFEHYHGPMDPEIDEVFLTPEARELEVRCQRSRSCNSHFRAVNC